MLFLKKCFPFICFAIASIAIARFCHHETQGFRLTKIRNNLSSEMDTVDHAQPECALNEALKQKFYYFNRGLQSFVFLSEDGHYILKIFNNRYQRKIAYFGFLSHFPFIKSWAQEKALYNRQKLARTFTSYQIATEELKTETGILYSHLNKSRSLPSSLTLIDRLHIAHEIDPNQFGFIVQKKAEMAYPTLLRLIRLNDLNEAKRRLTSLLQLLIRRCQKGIRDNDPLIRTNFGFLNNQAIEVDVGPFSKDPTFCRPEVYGPEIRHIAQSLKNWLNEQSPELASFLDQELQEQLSSRVFYQ